MTVSRYLSAVIGESAQQLARQHPSSRRRELVLALALHVPVAL